MNQTNVVPFALFPIVDEYGVLCAEMAALKVRQAVLKKQMLDVGLAEMEGALFRITISTCVAETLDMEAVREKLSVQFITAHTIKTERTTVRCVSRSGGKVRRVA